MASTKKLPHLVGEEPFGATQTKPSGPVETKEAGEEDLGDDEVLKWLKRTGAIIPLRQASHEHR